MLPVFADSVRPTVELGGSVCGRLQHPLVDEDDPETRHPPFFAPDFCGNGQSKRRIFSPKFILESLLDMIRG